jgi:hypothetical protein
MSCYTTCCCCLKYVPTTSTGISICVSASQSFTNLVMQPVQFGLFFFSWYQHTDVTPTIKLLFVHLSATFIYNVPTSWHLLMYSGSTQIHTLLLSAAFSIVNLSTIFCMLTHTVSLSQYTISGTFYVFICYSAFYPLFSVSVLWDLASCCMCMIHCK